MCIRDRGVDREKYKAGGIAQVDLDRLELQRVQFESDLQVALVNLRTAKIQLLTLLDDRTPVEDVYKRQTLLGYSTTDLRRKKESSRGT